MTKYAVLSLHTCAMTGQVESRVPLQISVTSLREVRTKFDRYIATMIPEGGSYIKIPGLHEEGTRQLKSQIGWKNGSEYPYLDECLRALAYFLRSNGFTHIFAHRSSAFHEPVLQAAYALCGLEMPDVTFVDTLPLLRHQTNVGHRSIHELSEIHLSEQPQSRSADDLCHALRALLLEFEYQGLLDFEDVQGNFSFETRYKESKQSTDNKWVKEFLEADTDRNGFISKDEFQKWHALKAKRIFRMADINGDGVISKAEFKSMYRNLPEFGPAQTQ